MTKNKPEIIIKLIAIKGCGSLSVEFLIFVKESKNKPKYISVMISY